VPARGPRAVAPRRGSDQDLAPLTLGPQAPDSGLLAAGWDADLITVDADPLADISVLASTARVTGVWVGGRQVKGGGPAESV
jgi:hypothetical protein